MDSRKNISYIFIQSPSRDSTWHTVSHFTYYIKSKIKIRVFHSVLERVTDYTRSKCKDRLSYLLMSFLQGLHLLKDCYVFSIYNSVKIKGEWRRRRTNLDSSRSRNNRVPRTLDVRSTMTLKKFQTRIRGYLADIKVFHPDDLPLHLRPEGC